MEELAKKQRLAELQAAMVAKERDEPPSEDEAGAWVLVYRDVDDKDGNTVQWGVPAWLPKAEYDEWQNLRFGPGRIS